MHRALPAGMPETIHAAPAFLQISPSKLFLPLFQPHFAYLGETVKGKAPARKKEIDMLLKSAIATPFTLILCGAFATARATPQPQPTSLNRPSEARGHIEMGAIGSRTMKSQQVFSGRVHQSLAPRDPGLQGSPSRPALNKLPDTAQLPAANVAMKSVHKAAFVTVTSTGHSLGTARANAVINLTSADPRAYLISPTDGSLVAPVQTFVWSQGAGVVDYQLWVGSCYDCVDILGEDEGRNTSRTVDLPDDGRIVYVTLFSHVGGYWYWVDYQFVASGAVVPASLTSPGNGATLNYTQAFTWNTGYNVTDHWLTIGSCFECGDLLDEDQGAGTSRTVSLPKDGRTIFVTLYSVGNDGNWYWYDYQFRAFYTTTVTTYRVNITNDYLYPTDIFVNGALAGSVNASSTQYIDLNVSPMTMSFELVQPVLDGKTLGDPVSGYWNTLSSPAGTYNLEASYQLGSTYYFLPQISNLTSSPLSIEVNGGLEAQNICNCEAPANTDNVRAGYYELFSNSNVRLFLPGSNYTGAYLYFGNDANGAVSPSGPLYKLVQVPSGLLSLSVSQLP
jgi:hypothetical protein